VGHLLQDSATWLDEVKEAAPNSIERRVTGVASEARRHGYEWCHRAPMLRRPLELHGDLVFL
jgi:hypothetical protein